MQQAPTTTMPASVQQHHPMPALTHLLLAQGVEHAHAAQEAMPLHQARQLPRRHIFCCLQRHRLSSKGLQRATDGAVEQHHPLQATPERVASMGRRAV